MPTSGFGFGIPKTIFSSGSKVMPDHGSGTEWYFASHNTTYLVKAVWQCRDDYSFFFSLWIIDAFLRYHKWPISDFAFQAQNFNCGTSAWQQSNTASKVDLISKNFFYRRNSTLRKTTTDCHYRENRLLERPILSHEEIFYSKDKHQYIETFMHHIWCVL